MWPHCSLSAVQRQINSEPFPDLILVFYVEGEIAGLPWKACPPKQAYVYSLDSSVFLWLRKQRPKIPARPVQGYFRMKDVDRRIEAITQMLSQRTRRLSVLSSTCQHVATLQFVRGAETDKFRAFSRPHPCFLRWRWDCGFALESLPAKTGICILLRHQCFSVVAQATPQDSCKPSPRLFSNERRQ